MMSGVAGQGSAAKSRRVKHHQGIQDGRLKRSSTGLGRLEEKASPGVHEQNVHRSIIPIPQLLPVEVQRLGLQAGRLGAALEEWGCPIQGDAARPRRRTGSLFSITLPQ